MSKLNTKRMESDNESADSRRHNNSRRTRRTGGGQ